MMQSIKIKIHVRLAREQTYEEHQSPEPKMTLGTYIRTCEKAIDLQYLSSRTKLGAHIPFIMSTWSITNYARLRPGTRIVKINGLFRNYVCTYLKSFWAPDEVAAMSGQPNYMYTYL